MASPSADMENYIAEFNGITEKLENGRDVCDLMTGFWEKLAKIEQAYAKQLVDLCRGRYARLETLLGQTKLLFAGGADKPPLPASLEHIGSLQDCWVKVVGEVQRLASEHDTLASHVTTKVAPTITKFTREKLKDEVARAATGKRLLNDAKVGYQRIASTKRKYFSDVATAAAATATASKGSGGDGNADAGDDAADERVEPPSKQLYADAVRELNDKHGDIFMVGLPGVLRDINTIEQDRAQMLCSCMNQYTQSAAALKNALTFDATAAALEATTRDPAVTQLVMMNPVPGKVGVEQPTAESLQQEQSEAQATSLLTAMSGWLSSKRAGASATTAPDDGDAKEGDVAAAAAADPAAATMTATEPEKPSKLASFFSGWGRKKPQQAEEAKVDTPGLVDSTDGSVSEPAAMTTTTLAEDEGEGEDDRADSVTGGGEQEVNESSDGVSPDVATATAASTDATAAADEPMDASPAADEGDGDDGASKDATAEEGQ